MFEKTKGAVGQWGEEIAARFLERKGYRILERNFRRKWGEIDIVALKASDVPRGTSLIGRLFRSKNSLSFPQDGRLVFVEVKTLQTEAFRPEENVTPWKQKRLIRSCELYLSSKGFDLDSDWQIDVIAILLNKYSGKAIIRHIEQAVY
jgi:putative endonuclease